MKFKMPKIIFLKNKKIFFDKKVVVAFSGETILNVALRNKVVIEHYCQGFCVCGTCHCIIKKGFNSLKVPSEIEEDVLEKVLGSEFRSRLSCQAIVGKEDLIVRIPSLW